MQTNNEKKVGAALVVGGGIGGMQAAIDLADAGFKVYLIEKQPAIGGHMAALDKTFPTNDCAMCTISPRLISTANHHNIEILTNSELLKLEGEAGRFTATVRRNPRYIDVTKCTACGDCAAVCPILRPDRFNRGLNQRKAAYKLYPQAVPNAYAIEKKGVAPCRDACPAGQRAQGYIALIREERYEEALRVIKEDNPFPGICGRICNHRCETACNRNLVDEPIAIASLKRFVADHMYAQPYVAPQPAPHKYDERIAIIGSGPCGLTAARDLVMAGYGVTVFEALPVAGGMLRVGVPEYRLPTWIVNREVQEIVDLGVELRLNTPVENLNDIFSEGFNAVLIAVGAHEGKRLPIPGADHAGVLNATCFLRDVRLGSSIDLKGRHVLVLGGGNVAMDCARTAVRLDAKQVDVACLERRETMPADEWEIKEAEQEGIKLYPARSFTSILSDNGRLTGVEALDVSFMQFEPCGTLTLETVSNSDHTLPCDTVIFAIGQCAGLSFIPEDTAVGVTPQGLVAVNPNTFATDHPGVFAAGDATSGTAFVIEAVDAGHKAAVAIQKYMCEGFTETRRHADMPVVELSPADVAARNRRGEIDSKPRVPMASLEAETRFQSFKEVNLGYTEAEAQAEAARCLQCGVCSECLACYYKCDAEAINHEELAQVELIEAGAVILSPGNELFTPDINSEYGYGRYPNVILSLEFERILSPSGPFGGRIKRLSDNRHPEKIAFIQCVGSREVERNYCSSVCCMYATKEAIVAKEHDPDLDCHIFYIDIRAFGKGFEQYYQRARQLGVKYTRCRPSSIKEVPATKNLMVSFYDENQSLMSAEFDLVVLSCGMQPPKAARDLAEILDIELNPHGFCRTDTFAPLATTRPGIYACGTFVAPKDIPETVMEASGASSKAMSLLAEVRNTLITKYEFPPELDISGQDPRIGVFVCHCGKNIGGIADVPAICDYAKTLPNVVYSEDTLYACSSDTQERIKEKIVEHNLNRVVVASCTPRTHEPLFRNTCREAGLNLYLFEMANIRDQNTWVHMHEPEKATQKAMDLVRIAAAKARLLEPLQSRFIDVEHDALVIGGGISGMTAALELANQGFTTHLVERSGDLGGNMKRIHFLLEDGCRPQQELASMVEKTYNHPKINVYASSNIQSIEGSMGNFKTTLGTTNGEIAFKHGVVIVATGAREYQPKEYLYGEDPMVITQLKLEEKLAQENKMELKTASNPDLNQVDTVTMIQCVGSRDEDRPYCSRICCSTAIKNAIRFKQFKPDAQVYVLYRDVRAYGFNEEYYRTARENGVIFLRYHDDEKPEVKRNNGRLTVSVNDQMLNTNIAIETDIVVLSAGIVPDPANEELAQKLKVPLTEDKFFLEAHMKLRPVDFSTDGIFLCGLAHAPKTVSESIVQACAAAARAATILAKDRIELDAVVSHVIDENCDGCAYCIDPCPYGALTLLEYMKGGAIKKTVERDIVLCKGCGSCQATCPKSGIFVANFKLSQLQAMADAALEAL